MMPSRWQSGLPETVCGRGSKLSETEVIREWLPILLDKYRILSIADVGCGDQNWIKHADLKNASYTGFDGDPYSNQIIQFDVAKDVLFRPYDLVMCIYVMNHLYEQGAFRRAVTNIIASGSKYLLMTYNDVEGVPPPLQDKLIDSVFHKKKVSGQVSRRWYYGVFKL